MRFRILGKTGLKVSQIGFGGWAIGGTGYGVTDDPQSLEALGAAFENGVNFFDTADVYGEGHSETLIGKFLKTKPRDRVVLATKGGIDFSHGPHQKNFSKLHLLKTCEKSLKRFGTETIDLYQLHNPPKQLIENGEPVTVLAKLKEQGKIGHIGISVHTEDEALAALEDSRIEALQLPYNILDQRMGRKVFPEAKKKNKGVIVREPLASGLLTGKYPPDHEFPKTDHRRRWRAEKREWDWEKVLIVQKTIGRHGFSTVQAALEFVLSSEFVSAAIPGAKTKEQVLENCRGGVESLMTAPEIQRLHALFSENPVFKKGLWPA